MELLTAGDNYVYTTSAEHLLMMLPDASIDMILTSPPYDNLRTYKGFSWNFEFIAHQSYRVLKPGGVLVWVVGDSVVDGSETLTSFRQALYFKDAVGFRMHDTMIWERGARYPDANRYYQSFEHMFVLSKGSPKTYKPVKKANVKAGVPIIGRERKVDGSLKRMPLEGSPVKNEGVMPNVWHISAGFNLTTKDAFAFEHPAMFPEQLAERHILTWTNPGDLVLDFFMGSGTTAKMARNNGRRFIGCDIAAEYVDLTNRRLEKPFNLQMFAENIA